MPKLPIVTVVIPSYNYAQFVGRAIDSVLKQTLTNFELIVVDDGSTDNTEEAVMTAFGNDKRCKYIRKDNSGVADTRNMGVFSGVGKYVCCLDADDRIAERFLEYCVRYLEENPEISIAYTGLYYVKPDGEEGLSPWPGQFDYDMALEGRNQLPTCNVAKREVWERLGGQRQRYAPGGAGEEDAEMWLRAGAYGFRAKKITNDGLFIYSWMSGRVSGSKDHRTTNYRQWHPWTRDGKHPFMSIATPERFSHPVRKYSRPMVSVIIPVGPGHSRLLSNALDSLEAQAFRGWECILVWDSNDDSSFIKKAYPYAKIIETGGGHGAGYARNRGAEAARAPLLLFLDADDWLVEYAIDRIFSVWEYNDDSIIYSDYVGKAYIDNKLADRLKREDRLLEHDPKSGLATILYKAFDFDYDKAVVQPDRNMYIWNLVTSLVPKRYHDEIGGFDENMDSWEDWDYYIRMAKAGKCFVRIAEPLVVYRFYSGGRRESGLQDHKQLIQYLLSKYKGLEIMGCNCRNKKTVTPAAPYPQASPLSPQSSPMAGGQQIMQDSQFVMIHYDHPNKGQHKVIGASTHMDYGYRAGGDEFLVHKNDIALQPNIFVVKPAPVVVREPAENGGNSSSSHGTAEVAPTPLPTPLDESEDLDVDEDYYDFSTIKGLGKPMSNLLHSNGIHTLSEAKALSAEKLKMMKAKRASIVYDCLQAA